jgi:sugar/nucleoside kinase (ribokinase family)
MGRQPNSTDEATKAPRALFVGRTTLDVLYRLDRLPEEDTKVFARSLQAAPGGPALNAAVTHSLLGGKAMLVSAVGRGPWAGVVRAELHRHGIELLDLAAETAYETPLCTALINAENGSRTVVNPPISEVCLRRLTGSWAAEIPTAWGHVPAVVLSDGFLLHETLPLLAACQAAGAALCLDSGSWKSGIADLAGLLTVAVCSERFSVPGHPHTPEDTLAWFAGRGVPSAAVTRGARSIVGNHCGRRFEIEIAPVDAVDTLGAGDVLHGAFCHHFARHGEFEPALRWAAEIATLKCRTHGVEAWVSRLPNT